MRETGVEYDLGGRSRLYPTRNKVVWLMLFGVSLSFFLATDWKPPAAVILALSTSVVVWFPVIAGTRFCRSWLDARRGLERRAWTAVNALGNCAESSAKANFDSYSRTLLRNTDQDVVMGYATILVCLLATERLSTDSGSVSQLAVRSMDRWLKVIRQHPDRLRHLLTEALAYEDRGFPASDWDNIRGMAALTGVLRTPRLRAVKLRFQVADLYVRYVDAHRGT